MDNPSLRVEPSSEPLSVSEATARQSRGLIAPLKIGYSDGSGLDELVITNAHDQPVVWGRTSLDPAVSGVESAAVAGGIVKCVNSHEALVKALEEIASKLSENALSFDENASGEEIEYALGRQDGANYAAKIARAALTGAK